MSQILQNGSNSPRMRCNTNIRSRIILPRPIQYLPQPDGLLRGSFLVYGAPDRVLDRERRLESIVSVRVVEVIFRAATVAAVQTDTFAEVFEDYGAGEGEF